MNGLLAPLVVGSQTGIRWTYVTRRFQRFVANLNITDAQVADGQRKQAGVRAALNRHYYGHSSEELNSMLIGSWGKALRVRPPRDIDILFFLPASVYHRFEGRTGNKQSQLLQEVRGVLANTFSQSELRGDGQVVVIRFATMPVEVVPAFQLDSGQFLICDTHWDGSYRLSDPVAEIAALNRSDAATGGATRRLIRMAKQWQRHCNVPIKSFLIERLAIIFLDRLDYSYDWFWHDWMVRDFFGFMASHAGRAIVMPGTDSVVPLGDEWASRARTAHAGAIRACAYEAGNDDLMATLEWQTLFGSMVPFIA